MKCFVYRRIDNLNINGGGHEKKKRKYPNFLCSRKLDQNVVITMILKYHF